MHKLLVFDLDGTLAEPGQRMAEKEVEKLIVLENRGYRIVLCSGKTSYYLCGFARQLGLKNPIFAGENGGTFQFGIELPPKRYEEYPCSEQAKAQIRRMKALLDKTYGNKIWYQPNVVGISPFPANDEIFSDLQRLIDEKRPELDELEVYRHWDCFDLMPKNVNKKNGIRYLTDLLGMDRSEVIAIGDGINDIPMFEFADIAIGVLGKDAIDEQGNITQQKSDNVIREYIDYGFATIGEVLDFILEKCL